MRAILEHCEDLPEQHMAGGTVLLAEGQSTGRVYVLVSGRIEVLRGDTQVTILDEPGSLVGEMSYLLGTPHTATARVLGEATVRVAENAEAFFRAHPELSWLIARLLAFRLKAATTYLVDLKQQFSGSGDHLEMVGEVLETLLHQQERDFHPGSDRDPGMDDGARDRAIQGRASTS
ncbi:cyclic nucleotide-binding domain-containing protein [Starkeya sp. ORNL1]|uniref:Crp/Fnr family transcriptional regulator n=1 Tax=Starkeya sp. ORNL1 TaxID=2709380 RepID=UPI0014637237|nr:cyclic nucleotide-binding domain-containing protein [Starkeya sp. ORNL1]QJP17287.1 cyclic nucleotide-binding domain-containing protein [Starkeya sp. ORNL1]